jgi:hypothetical protein
MPVDQLRRDGRRKMGRAARYVGKFGDKSKVSVVARRPARRAHALPAHARTRDLAAARLVV